MKLADVVVSGVVVELARDDVALTLEYLETDFCTVKGRSVKLSGEAKSLPSQFGDQEAQHVEALTKAIQGAGAYNGAGPSLQNVALLAAAGSIVQVEGRHAAAIGRLTNRSPVPNGGFVKPLSKQQVLAQAGPLIKG